MVKIQTDISAIELIFDEWGEVLNSDYFAYKNHVYRVFHFCMALHNGNSRDEELFIIASCFHDIGIWTNNTFDYLNPSIELAKMHLDSNNKMEWLKEIELMINFHHKITSYRNKEYPLVEVFRRADWIDVTRGKKTFGLAKSEVKAILDHFPNNNFHKKLIELTKAEFRKKPLKPLPMMKW